MKLEGWIAIEKPIDDEDEESKSWAADRCKEDLEGLMKEYTWIDWNDPVPCTITIPPSGESEEK